MVMNRLFDFTSWISRSGAFVCVLTLAGPASGVTLTWDGSSGNWDTDASWLPGGTEPTAGDDVNINAGLVTVSGAGQEAGLVTIGAGGTLRLTNPPLFGPLGELHATQGFDNSSGGVFEHLGGTLTVSGGALKPNMGGPTDDYTIGSGFSSFSQHVILGAGASAAIGRDLIVGDQSFGELTLAGGTISNRDGHIGRNFGFPQGTVTVSGAGSTWTNTRDLYIGADLPCVFVCSAGPTHTLNIQAGAAVTNTTGYMGFQYFSPSAVTVTGANSSWTSSTALYVGGSDTASGGTSTLDVLDSGRVDVNGPMKIWDTATVNLNGGSIVAASIDHTEGGTFNFTDGTLSVGTFTGTLDQDGGTLAPGSSPGITAISGNYNLNAGTLGIEVGGLSAGTQFDQVTVSGSMTINTGTTLDLNLINSFTPTIGDTLPIIASGSLSGQFDNVIGADFAPGKMFDLNYNAGNLVLEVIGLDTVNTITDFEVDEGYFPNNATFSGSNIGIIGATADRVETEAQQGIGSQEIIIDGEEGGWFFRHVAGIGAVADPAGNLPIDTVGSVGFWLMTTTPGMEVSLTVDDPGTADRGLFKPVIADGQWHAYEWDLEDDAQWEGWVTGDGIISGLTTTLDSLQFTGAGDAVIYLDSITYNLLGSIDDTPLVGDLDGDGFVGLNDLDLILNNWNQTIPPGNPLADPTGYGFVGLADLDIVLNNWNTGTPPTGQANIPEPGVCLMMLGGGFIWMGRRR